MCSFSPFLFLFRLFVKTTHKFFCHMFQDEHVFPFFLLGAKERCWFSFSPCLREIGRGTKNYPPEIRDSKVCVFEKGEGDANVISSAGQRNLCARENEAISDFSPSPFYTGTGKKLGSFIQKIFFLCWREFPKYSASLFSLAIFFLQIRRAPFPLLTTPSSRGIFLNYFFFVADTEICGESEAGSFLLGKKWQLLQAHAVLSTEQVFRAPLFVRERNARSF